MKSMFIAFLCMFSVASLAQPSASTKWNLASAYPTGNFHSKLLVEFATEVDKASAGRLQIVVHPGASLFRAPEIKRAVQGGQIQSGEILLGNFQNENQIFGVDSIPFVVGSYDEAFRLWQSQKPVLEKILAKQGMLLLYTVPWPPQGIYSKKLINSAADLRGAKFRVQSPAASRIAELVGAQPITIQAAEIAQAMATGIVEVTMMSGATGVDSKIWEHMRFFHDTQAWIPKNAVVVNKKAFDMLDATTQKAVMKAAADMETKGWAESRRVMNDTTNTLKSNGMTVLSPSAQLKSDMQKVGNTLLQEWLKNAGTDGEELVKSYKK
jgi:TRAP-type C4-dicarboxylate transport system substrate-binding protein